MNTIKAILTSKGLWIAIGAAILVNEFYPRLKASIMPAATK